MNCREDLLEAKGDESNNDDEQIEEIEWTAAEGVLVKHQTIGDNLQIID